MRPFLCVSPLTSFLPKFPSSRPAFFSFCNGTSTLFSRSAISPRFFAVSSLRSFVNVRTRQHIPSKTLGMMADYDAILFGRRLSDLAKEGRADEIRDAIEERRKEGKVVNQFHYCTLMDSLLTAGRHEEVCRVYREMRQAGTRTIDTRPYDYAITAFVEAGKMDEVEKVLLDLVQDRLRPSYFTFGRIMSALCQRGETEQAEEWLQRQQSQWALQPNRVQYAMLIHYFAKSDKPDKAIHYLERARAASQRITPRMLTQLVASLCRAGRTKEAQKYLAELRAMGFTPLEQEVANSLEVRIQATRHRLHQVLKDYSEDEIAGKSVSVVRFNIIMRELIRYGSYDAALAAFQYRQNSGLELTLQSWNMYLHLLCRMRKLDEAKELFEKLRQRSLADGLMYSTLMYGLADAGRSEEVFALHREMKERGLRPGQLHFKSLIRASLDANNVQWAQQYLDEMLELGIEPTPGHFISLMRAYNSMRRLDDAERLFAKCARFGILNDYIFSIMVYGASICGRLERAREIVEAAMKSGYASADVFDILIKAYEYHQLPKEAAEWTQRKEEWLANKRNRRQSRKERKEQQENDALDEILTSTETQREPEQPSA